MTISTRRDATENRIALLDAARLELNRDIQASIETIAASAGLSRRAVYGHFANRDDLLRELLTTGAARIAAAIETTRRDDPLVDLAIIAAQLWHEVESIRVMALFAVRGPFESLTAEALAPLRRRVLADVKRGQSAGGIRTDQPASILARLIEQGALAVLDEATTSSLSSPQGRTLVVQTALALAGLGWREANDLISSIPELQEQA